MKNDYIYIMACKRGQKEHEIYGIWNNDKDAIMYWRKYVYGSNNPSYNINFMAMFKFPVNTIFCDIDTWSKVKFGKSTKYRMKLSLEELDQRYEQVLREKKLERILKDE
jgi:hypothetical protein